MGIVATRQRMCKAIYNDALLENQPGRKIVQPLREPRTAGQMGVNTRTPSPAASWCIRAPAAHFESSWFDVSHCACSHCSHACSVRGRRQLRKCCWCLRPYKPSADDNSSSVSSSYNPNPLVRTILLEDLFRCPEQTSTQPAPAIHQELLVTLGLFRCALPHSLPTDKLQRYSLPVSLIVISAAYGAAHLDYLIRQSGAVSPSAWARHV